MVQVALRPMTEAEYADWRSAVVATYAADHVAAGSLPADHAHEMAEAQFAQLLPDGVTTLEHHLLVPELDGTAVGYLWLHVPRDRMRAAFVYGIEIDDERRGQGLGRTVMIAGESFARDRGAVAIRLHVFGSNTTARRLYQSLGYETTNVTMSKSLDTGTAESD